MQLLGPSDSKIAKPLTVRPRWKLSGCFFWFTLMFVFFSCIFVFFVKLNILNLFWGSVQLAIGGLCSQLKGYRSSGLRGCAKATITRHLQVLTMLKSWKCMWTDSTSSTWFYSFCCKLLPQLTGTLGLAGPQLGFNGIAGVREAESCSQEFKGFKGQNSPDFADVHPDSGTRRVTLLQRQQIAISSTCATAAGMQ